MDFLDNQDFDSRIHIDFFIRPLLYMSKFSIKALLKKSRLKLERIIRFKIDKSHQTKKNLGSWECSNGKPEDWKFNRIFFSKSKVGNCDTHEGNQNCSYGKTESILLTIFRNFRTLKFWCRDKYQWLFNRILLYRSKIFPLITSLTNLNF